MTTPARRGRVFRDGQFKSGPNRGKDRWGYVVDIQAPGQPRRQQRRRGFASKGEAVAALNEVCRDLAVGEFVPPKDLTLSGWFDSYVGGQEHAGELRPTTASLYRSLFKRHVEPRLGAVRLQDVGVEHLDALYVRLREEGRRDGRGGLSASAVRSIHAMLSGAFASAVRKGHLRRNSATDATPPKALRAETPCWSTEEVRQFLDQPIVRDDPDYPVVRLAATSGLRRGELLALRWEDVDLEAGVLEVRATAVEVDRVVRLGPPKTRRSQRRVKVGPRTVEVLAAHRQAQGGHREVMGAGWHDLDLVFPAIDGRLRRPTSLSIAFSKLAKRVGMPPGTLHGLRHRHESDLVEAGWPLHVVAQRMGHDVATMVSTYLHASEDSQDRIDVVEALLDGSRPPLMVLEGNAPEPSSPAAADQERRALP